MRLIIVAWLAASAVAVVVLAWNISPWVTVLGVGVGVLLLALARDVWRHP